MRLDIVIAGFVFYHGVRQVAGDFLLYVYDLVGLAFVFNFYADIWHLDTLDFISCLNLLAGFAAIVHIVLMVRCYRAMEVELVAAEAAREHVHYE